MERSIKKCQKKENKALAETLLPIFEQLLKAANGKYISVNIQSERNYGYLTVGEYEIVRLDNEINLEYRPKGRVLDWEREWSKPWPEE